MKSIFSKVRQHPGAVVVAIFTFLIGVFVGDVQPGPNAVDLGEGVTVKFEQIDDRTIMLVSAPHAHGRGPTAFPRVIWKDRDAAQFEVLALGFLNLRAFTNTGHEFALDVTDQLPNGCTFDKVLVLSDGKLRPARILKPYPRV